jgi:hypothetical protein
MLLPVLAVVVMVTDLTQAQRGGHPVTVVGARACCIDKHCVDTKVGKYGPIIHFHENSYTFQSTRLMQ